eukprot:COSAG02_NODE_201_length_29473_cov_135.510213_8_plen_56_part_00
MQLLVAMLAVADLVISNAAGEPATISPLRSFCARCLNGVLMRVHVYVVRHVRCSS